MQTYKKLDPTEALKTSIPAMQESIDSVASSFSGTAFPTENLFVGMHCVRTDLNTEYVCTKIDENGAATWQDVNNLTLHAGQAETDGDGNSITKTYLKKSDASSTYLSKSDASGTYLTKSDASNTYYPKSSGESLAADVQSNVQAVKDMQATISGHTSSISSLDTKVKANTDAINNLDISGDIKNQTFTVTASTQKTQYTRISAGASVSNGDGSSGNVGSGDYTYTGADMRTDTGIAKGTYTLTNLLQMLVNKSHTHRAMTYTYHGNCNCNCNNTC